MTKALSAQLRREIANLLEYRRHKMTKSEACWTAGALFMARHVLNSLKRAKARPMTAPKDR